MSRALGVLVFWLASFAPCAWSQVTGTPATESVSRETRPRLDSQVANSVDAGTGAFLVQRKLLSIQGGRSLDFTPEYNSLLTQSKGAMGFGWSHPYEAYLDGDPQGTVTVHWDINRKNSFRFASSGSPYEALDEAARYDKLTRLGDGSWTLTRLDGSTYQFTSTGELRRLGNKVLQYLEMTRTDGRLTEIREPISNKRITLKYARDGSGLLETITDPAGRILFFSYDSAQRLAALRNPVALATEQHGDFIVPKNIPDNDPAGLVQNIEVTRTEPIGLVSLFLANISHNRPQDLRVSLISPRGTEYFFQRRTDSTNPWDLTAAIVDAFDGENPQGSWKVKVVDTAAGSLGSLNAWIMNFTDRSDPVRYSYDAAGRIAMATGPDGERMYSNVYDAQGRVVAQDDGLDTNGTATFAYEEISGTVKTTYTDRLGNKWVLEHDSGYHLLSGADPLGNVTAYAYSAQGDRTRVTDPLGRRTVFNYDQDGNLITILDPELNATTVTYDSRHNPLTIRDALGKTTTFAYDTQNNLTSVTDAAGNRDRKSYGANSQITGVILQDSAGMNYGYASGMLTSASHPAGGGSSGAAYDALGRATRLTDPDGFSIQIAYNTRGEVISRTDALGKSLTMAYDRRGRLVRKTNRRGNVTSYGYDGNDNLISETNGLGLVTRYEFDGEDRPVRTVDANGNATTVTYDAAGRAISETDALGNARTREYDAAGNEVAVRDGKGVRVSSTTYDSRDLPVAEADAFGHTSTSSFDAVERVTQTKNSLNEVNALTYDALDRLTEVRDPLGRTLKEEFFSDDVVSSYINARGSATLFKYDPANRLREVETATGARTTFTFNGRDLVTRETRPSGRRFDFTYDSAGRLTRRVTSVSGLSPLQIDYSYDDAGNLVGLSRRGPTDTSSVPRLSRSYDAANRLTRYTDGSGNTLEYSYDPAGNLSRLVYPDGKEVRYAYDRANRLTTVTDWAGRVTRYTYDANNRVTRIDLPNGTYRVMEYDANGQVLRRRDLTPQNAVIVDDRYSYDAAGRMGVEASAAARPAPASQTVTMTYDNDNRLRTYNSQTVSFDNDGNITQGPLPASPSVSSSSTYESTGNLIRAGGVTYVYDEEDRLVEFSTAGQSTRLVLNPGPSLSQTLVKIAPDGSFTRYVYGIGLIYEDTGGQTRTYHYDHRGSVVAFSGDSGSVTGTVAYGPYGEVVAKTGQSDALFLFEGLFGVITDPNGLNYMRFRWYSPLLKRFISADAHFGKINEAGSLNRFAYAGGNPVTFADPKGEFWTLIGAAAGALANVTAQAITDVARGQFSGWQTYAGAAVGGAVSGAILANCPTCAGTAGAAGAAAGYLTEKGLRGERVDPLELALTAGLGAAAGKVGQAGGKLFGGGASNRLAMSNIGSLSNAQSMLIRQTFVGALKTGVISGGAKVGLDLARDLLPRILPPAKGESSGVPGNAAIVDSGRQEVNKVGKGSYGEFIHWQRLLDALALAGRPIPNNPNNILTSF